MKKMLAAALAASMVMGLTACGGSSQPTETKAPESAKETEAAAEGTTEAAAAGDEEKKTGSEMTWKLATLLLRMQMQLRKQTKNNQLTT